MTQKFTNNATSKLATSVTAGATSFDVTAGDGALFPSLAGSDFFIATLVSSTAREIVKVTARATDTFTIVRAQEGTTAASFAAGDTVELRLTEGGLERFVQTGDSATGGDITGTYPTGLSLANTAVTPGSYGDASHSLAATVDAKGRLTALVANAIALAASAITSGLLALARGGTNADLSATGPGFLKQATTGAAVTVAAIVENDVGASTHDAGNTGTAITIDWSLARAQKCTATGNFTLTHSNMTAGLAYTLEVLTGAGSFTATFASTDWGSAGAPTLTTTASKRDVFTFYDSIGGTINGAVFVQASAP